MGLLALSVDLHVTTTDATAQAVIQFRQDIIALNLRKTARTYNSTFGAVFNARTLEMRFLRQKSRYAKHETGHFFPESLTVVSNP